MPGKIHVWTSRKHHTPRGYQGQEHMTRKCHQFPQKGPKNWPQNQHFAQKFCKMLLGFGPLWPLWPPRLAPLAPSLVRLWPPRLAPLAPWLGPFGPLAWPLWPPGLAPLAPRLAPLAPWLGLGVERNQKQRTGIVSRTSWFTSGYHCLNIVQLVPLCYHFLSQRVFYMTNENCFPFQNIPHYLKYTFRK